MPAPLQHWFLLRGLARESSHWGEFPKLFENALPRVRVHCLDLPGTGKRCEEKTPWRLSQMAASVRADFLNIIEEEKIDAACPKMVLAISMGAMVSLHWLSRFPRDLQGAVFINTSLKTLSPWYQRLSPAGYARMFQAVLEKDMVQRERHILELTSQAKNWDEADLRKRAELSRQHPMKRMNFVRQLIAAAMDLAPAKKPNVPLLLLNSLGDELVHPDCSARIQKSWGVTMHRHAWAGHDLPLDDPQWTIETIRQWLLENPSVVSSGQSTQKVANTVERP